MTRHQSTTKKDFLAVPVELRVYFIFSIVVSLLSILIPVASSVLWEKIVPSFGWIPAVPYMFSIFMIYALIYNKSIKAKKDQVRNAIIRMLTIQISYGLVIIIFNAVIRENQSQNPYLTIHWFQPIWTILIPVIWIIIFRSKRVTRFCQLSGL
jgi:hypothetical protein